MLGSMKFVELMLFLKSAYYPTEGTPPLRRNLVNYTWGTMSLYCEGSSKKRNKANAYLR